MMVLVDTSVWIDHLRSNEPELVQLLNSNRVLGHSFVRGELALGNLSQREVILKALKNLPQSPVAFNDEIAVFVENHHLFGLGIGLVDVHLLASTRLAVNAKLWTRDKRLLNVAKKLELAAIID